MVDRMGTVHTSTLAEQAYHSLRDRIVRGDLAVGQRLMPEELGQALSISPTPVKEALLMLERDGLIQSSARRGASVRRFTSRDIVDLYDARLMIEQRAISVGHAAGRLDAATLARLAAVVALHAERSTRRSASDLRQALQHDHELHSVLAGLAGNPLLVDWHQRLLRQTQLVRAYSLRAYDAGRLARAARDHAAILLALREGDPAAANLALETHLATSLASVLAGHS